MPRRVEKPGTAVQFAYRCAVPDCGFEDRYRDAVEDHESEHDQVEGGAQCQPRQ